ncbi:hypothetical protein ON010_g12297 [Phytophthora cinnamomi]|nr:hypothetical protein ON010_g12297 [Phytophthora cinnamomi]
MARTSSPSMQRFNWETAVARDPDLQRIDAFVQRTIAKLPGAAPPSSGAGRGSRYAPPLKSERPDSSTASTASTGTPAMVSTRRTSSSSSNSNSHADTSGSPQFINPRDYMSESSSEVDMREVNPMDELSDFESDASQQQQQQEQQEELEQQQQQDQDQPMDVEMDADAEQEEEADVDVDKNQTVCEVCRSSERERDIVLCDDCDAEYHVFCLSPPLPEVPEGTWYCPKCRVKYPDFEAAAAGVRVKAEKLRTARAGGAATESAGTAQANEATNAGEVAGTTTAPAPSGESEAANGGADGPASIPCVLGVAQRQVALVPARAYHGRAVCVPRNELQTGTVQCPALRQNP